MTEVNAYPQTHLFEDHLDSILAPTPGLETRVAFLSSSSEIFGDMSFDTASYYSSSVPAKQPLQAPNQAQGRSASVSSACSSSVPSHPSPQSSHHGALSRTLSPASGISEAVTVATTMATGSSYPQHPYTPQTSMMPSPSQYFSAPTPPPVPLYSQLPNLRQFTPSTSYAYHLGSIPSHPSPLSMQSFPALDYPSFATPHYSSASALQQYPQPSFQQYPNHLRAKLEPARESTLLKGLQKLPPDVIDKIHQSFTYLECWKIYAVCRWFHDKFHPHKLPADDKVAGVRYAEQYYRRYFPGRATSTSADGRTREYDSKYPGSFGCYHCFRILGPQNFELFKWNNQREEQDQESVVDEESTPKQSQKALPPPPPPAQTPSESSSSSRNPHYDPTLTRSNIVAAAAANNKNRRASRAGSTGTASSSSTTATATTTKPASQQGGSLPSTDSPRIKETWGIRRFCIQCGIAKRYYRPGDLIELCSPKEAVWVCKCWKIHNRPSEIKCLDCDSFIPLSTPNRRRG
ncbi:hypothetical protein QBC38DRAFT_150331 [Podospora fimiseda]|uniref:F-box domain-containing protein n=1 Tax=Podospora fimiseda TaxID=252190 RepID=A0AAN7BSC4_9PEZI|nr:hypothetical protein QBC38DRAFT_150331 [Podospora fimiseda]